MSSVIDLTNKRFGRLHVIEKSSTNYKGCATWLCRCDCGKFTIKAGDLLRRGSVKSCGCLFEEESRLGNPTHQKSRTRIYRIWSEMKSRCYSKTCPGYKNYGERGIIICDEWLDDFMNFYHWSMKNGYADELSIDRIDVNGNYEPSNCRWVDSITQNNNRRNNRLLTFRGATHTLAEWSRITGVNRQTISKRIKNGWGVESALTKSGGGIGVENIF